jgi:hypothetical protein
MIDNKKHTKTKKLIEVLHLTDVLHRKDGYYTTAWGKKTLCGLTAVIEAIMYENPRQSTNKDLWYISMALDKLRADMIDESEWTQVDEIIELRKRIEEKIK